MILGPPRNIAEALLQLFRERQEYTAAELLALIQKRHRRCSQRGLYKELQALIERGVVVRNGRRYSLSLSWVLAVLQFAEDMYGTLVDEHLKSSYLPARGEKKTWRFNDLQHLDRFWLQLIFLMFEESKGREMFVWVPYFWFDLIHYQKDLEAQEAMRAAGNKRYMILGEDAYISRLPTRYWSKEVYDWSYSKGPFDHFRSTYYDVIDDLVLTVELTPKTTREIAELFDAVRGPEDLWQIRRFSNIKYPAPSRLTIECNPRKAAKLIKRFRDFFGM